MTQCETRTCSKKNPEAIQLKEITQDLLDKKIYPILIGGDQSIDLVIHQVYQSLDKRLDITLIDNQIDLGQINLLADF